MDSIRRYRNKIIIIIIYFEVANNHNGLRNISFSILLALLFAKIYSKLMLANSLMDVLSLTKTEIRK
jgi:hypothetical protein